MYISIQTFTIKYLITTALLLSVIRGHSQTTIKSRIISTKSKEPVEFAHIFNKKTHVNTLTDMDGQFNISCSNTDTIGIRCVGYQSLSLAASEIVQRKIIELKEDTIMLNEVKVMPENLYKMILQARDSTNKYLKRYFQGVCSRQEQLSLNGNTERKSDAKIIFITKGIKNREAQVDYWLKDHKLSESLNKGDQPKLMCENTISFYPIKIRDEKAKYKIIENSDSLLIINAKMAEPNKQWIDECNYFINKSTWIFLDIEYKGDYRIKPLEKRNKYYFQIDVKKSYVTIGDSCELNKSRINSIFSYKKIDPKNLWEYSVNIDITEKNVSSMPTIKKLHRMDPLLYKNQNPEPD